MKSVENILNTEAPQPADIAGINPSDNHSVAFRKGDSRAAGGDPESVVANTVDEWLDQGIYLLTSEDFRSFNRHELEKYRFIFARGPGELLGNPTASIINSRRGKNVSPLDMWLQKTRLAVKDAIDNRLTVVSSLGALQYSIVTAASKGNELIVVCDGPLPFMASAKLRKMFFQEYSGLFDPARTLFLSAQCPGLSVEGSQAQRMRDEIVVALSDIIYPVDVKAGGNMERILGEAEKRKVHVRNIVFEEVSNGFTGIDPESSVVQEEVVGGGIGDRPAGYENKLFTGLNSFFSETLGSWIVCYPESLMRFELSGSSLFHYTRSCPGPWPGQTCDDYICSLLNNQPGATHTAFDTLVRIGLEQRIRGSDRLIRGKHVVVSFTEEEPSKLSSIRIWRTGFHRWSMEPYGVAIIRESLIKKGARQVRYGPPDLYRQLPEDEKFLFQLSRTKSYNWSPEKEWRMRGDLDIKRAPMEDLAYLLPTESEALDFLDLLRNNLF